MDHEEVLFHQDNASAHKAKVCRKWFEEQGIELVEWPANSLALNPIETLWSELKRRLGEYLVPSGGILELRDRVGTVLDGLEPEYCQRLIEGMPRRMAMLFGKESNVFFVLIMYVL